MNNLSWLLYWADVLPRIRGTICVFSVITLVLAGLITLVSCVINERLYLPRFTFWAMPIAIISITLTSFIPSKNTFYLIAGSEIGEQVAKTPEFDKIRKVINNWLDEQTKENSQAVSGGSNEHE